MREYEINEATMFIRPNGKGQSFICEEEQEYQISKSTNKIIKENCSFYGSSYIGRCEGTKSLTGIKSKFPIIIEESRKIIFFPTSSTRTKESTWLALNQIKDIQKDSNGSRIIFKNDTKIKLPISYYSLKNQYCRAIILKAKLYERIKGV